MYYGGRYTNLRMWQNCANTHTIQIYTHANEYKQSWKNLNKTGGFLSMSIIWLLYYTTICELLPLEGTE